MRSKRMAVGTNYYNASAYPWDTGGGCTGNEICNADLAVQGNVGIGTTGPSTLLHVYATAASLNKPLLRVEAVDTGQSTYASDLIYGSVNRGDTTAYNLLNLSNIGTAKFVVRGDGNVGIGTTGPVVRLEVDATAAATPPSSGTTASGNMRLTNTGNAGGGSALDIGGTSASPYVYWIQNHNRNDQSVNYPLALQPNGGAVGIGTTSPSKKTHIVDTSLTGTTVISNDGQLMIEGNTASNTLTSLLFGRATLPVAKIVAQYTDSGSKLHFLTSNSYGVGITTNVMTMDYLGNVGIGTTGPAAKLTVRGSGGDANSFYRIENTAGFSRSIYMGGGSDIYFNNGVNNPYLSDAGVWNSASDSSFKKDIVDMKKYGLETVMRLKPREYRIKRTDEEQIGFIAQEVKGIIPELVSGEDGKMGFSYDQLTAVLAKAIQEQQKEIEELRAKLARLEAKMIHTK